MNAAASERIALWKRWWGTLHEPRPVTAATMAAYLMSFAVGVRILMYPANSPTEYDWAVRLFAGVFLVFGGGVGAPAAHMGARWLERSAALSVAAGYVVIAIYAVAIEARTDLVMPVVTVMAALTTALLALSRFFYVRTTPYAPGKGPLTADVKQQIQAIAAE